MRRQSCLGTVKRARLSKGTVVSGPKRVWHNLSGHSLVWAQACLGTKRVKTQTCQSTIMPGHKRGETKFCVFFTLFYW